VERIDFYVLDSADQRAAELFTCRLTEKAFGQSHRIYIRTRDRAQAEALDELLWTFRQGSFVPHALAAPKTDEPVLIGEAVPTEGFDLLINLGDELSADWERFGRLAEIVDQTPQVLEAARQRFRRYRERGFEPHYHKLEAGA
jgi:DNA polymerase-3 subunit chi